MGQRQAASWSFRGPSETTSRAPSHSAFQPTACLERIASSMTPWRSVPAGITVLPLMAPCMCFTTSQRGRSEAARARSGSGGRTPWVDSGRRVRDTGNCRVLFTKGLRGIVGAASF